MRVRTRGTAQRGGARAGTLTVLTNERLNKVAVVRPEVGGLLRVRASGVRRHAVADKHLAHTEAALGLLPLDGVERERVQLARRLGALRGFHAQLGDLALVPEEVQRH
jgi:hypothetical protein